MIPLPPQALDFPCWHAELILSDNGLVRSITANGDTVLANILKGIVYFDEFRGTVTCCGAVPWNPGPLAIVRPWTADDDYETSLLLQRDYGIVLRAELVHQIIQRIARRNSFDPLKAFFRELEWDRRPRLGDDYTPSWLSTYFGVRDTSYTRMVGLQWLVSGAVGRIYAPGGKAGVLILGGKVDPASKIKALELLFGSDFFSSDTVAEDPRTAQEHLRGLWCVGFDLDTPRTLGDSRSLRKFIGRRVDRMDRKAYPRHCVFAAITSRTDLPPSIEDGADWWPVRCTRIDLDALERDADRTWAEALHRYNNGELRQSCNISTSGSNVQEYLAERCEFHPGYVIEKSALHQDYELWCAAQSVAADDEKWFARRLRMARPGVIGNFRPANEAKSNTHRPGYFRGLRLRSD